MKIQCQSFSTFFLKWERALVSHYLKNFYHLFFSFAKKKTNLKIHEKAILSSFMSTFLEKVFLIQKENGIFRRRNCYVTLLFEA